MADIKDPEVVTFREPKTLAELVTGMNKTQLKGFLREAFSAGAPRVSMILR